LFPKVPDLHKPNRPMVPNGLGVFYALVSVTYLFLVYFFDIIRTSDGASEPLTLAVCILFGGFMGMLDDWIDLKWRYKAFLPLVVSIPLLSLGSRIGLRTSMSIPVLGTINFGSYYYYLIVPLLVTIFTNTVNQLGGLNGLETVCPAIIMIGLMIVSGSNAVMLYGPLAIWLLLTLFNFRGKIFVGNTGSFSIGMTLTAFAIISNLKLDLAISLLPCILNSALILLTFFLFRTRASVSFDGEKLHSSHRQSLITLVTYHRGLTERRVVLIISLLVAISTIVATLIQLLWTPI
jgi:UDP-N-acetylglucosamine--dolichyl-phosphate N-acetylglucosaminephosphotransferase